MPLGSGIKPETFTSFIAMLYQSANIQLYFNFYNGPYIHENRNQIVEEAKRAECTHIMFIDNDMAFPSDGMLNLIKHDKDIVGGAYKMKTTDLKGTVKVKSASGELLNVDNPPSALFQCDVIPAGFMLVKMEVFDKLEFPYFFTDYEGREVVGEDVYFCKKAKEAGYEVWCDGNIKLGHVGSYIYR